MINEFISISDAAKRYDVSTNTIRKIVRSNVDTDFIQKVAIKGKHGFKYLVSTKLLDNINKPKSEQNYTKNQAESKENETVNDGKQFDNENSSQFVSNLVNENKQLNKRIDKQNQIIEKLTDTISEQNKVIISQAMQVHQLTEQTTHHPTEHPTEQKTNDTSNTSEITSDKTRTKKNKQPSVLYFVIFALIGLVIVLMFLVSQ